MHTLSDKQHRNQKQYESANKIKQIKIETIKEVNGRGIKKPRLVPKEDKKEEEDRENELAAVLQSGQATCKQRELVAHEFKAESDTH